jgi:CRISPR system Cascade subunit CasB
MNRSDLGDMANGTGSYARACILGLQSSLLNEGGRSASAKATLSQWRRMATNDDYSLLGLGAEFLNGWPEERLGAPRSGTWQLNALCATLGLYAWHQQSLSYPVCDVSTESHRANTFARACRLIEYDLDSAGGVRRRLSGIEAAADFGGVVLNIRALISLMKSARNQDMGKRQISFDYGALARDLCLMQATWARKRVINQWGIDYFGTAPHEEAEALPAQS